MNLLKLGKSYFKISWKEVGGIGKPVLKRCKVPKYCDQDYRFQP